jgi:hypothetical protein
MLLVCIFNIQHFLSLFKCVLFRVFLYNSTPCFAYNRRPCLDSLSMTGHSCRNQMPRRCELLPQWQQNRSKGTVWLLCTYTSSYFGAPKTFLVEWRLFVACYCPATSTEYSSTTRGRSVYPPVAVNIEFCGFSENNSGQKLCSLHRSVLILQPTVDSSAGEEQCDLCLQPYWSLREQRCWYVLT